jgi:signal transduction histidine kinase
MSSQGLIEKFIYSCSHDLRAPVSSIQGLVRIAEYYPHHDEIHKCLEMIEACTHEMDKRLSTLRQYMVNDQHTLVFETIDPLELIQKAKSEFRNQLGVCKIDLVADTGPAPLWTIDKYCALRILEHLISNSIAFHDPEKKESKIIVRVESNDRGSVLEVSDNGKGIPEDQQARIFDVFYRATEDSIGPGMGLFLAQSLTEKMGGRITCTSTLHLGTTIRVSFPKL